MINFTEQEVRNLIEEFRQKEKFYRWAIIVVALLAILNGIIN